MGGQVDMKVVFGHISIEQRLLD